VLVPLFAPLEPETLAFERPNGRTGSEAIVAANINSSADAS